MGKNRALVSLSKLQELNYYVSCDAVPANAHLTDLMSANNEFNLTQYSVIILVNYDIGISIQMSTFCRQAKIYFINAECYGLYSRIFCDFGDNFTVLDKDG